MGCFLTVSTNDGLAGGFAGFASGLGVAGFCDNAMLKEPRQISRQKTVRFKLVTLNPFVWQFCRRTDRAPIAVKLTCEKKSVKFSCEIDETDA